MDITPGLEATVEHIVSESDTAVVLGSGDAPVLGTPKVVAMCEEAATRAVAEALGTGQTSVGARIDLVHTAPTVPGRRVVARARLDGVDGRTLQFSVEASDPGGAIAHGTHTRVVVDRDRFLRGASER